MGYAVPASIGAKLARPERLVVAFVGDGGFLMTGQGSVTAVQEALPVKVVLGDNGAYGTIAMHQRSGSVRTGSSRSICRAPTSRRSPCPERRRVRRRANGRVCRRLRRRARARRPGARPREDGPRDISTAGPLPA